MKKLLFLLLFPSLLNAQTPIYQRGPINQIYHLGTQDTTIQYFYSIGAYWYTNRSFFDFNKPVFAPMMFVNGDSVCTLPQARSLLNEVDPIWTAAQPNYVTRIELGDTAADIRASGPGSVYNSIKIGTGNDTTIIRTDGTIHQYYSGNEVFKTTITGKMDYTAGTSSTFVRVPGVLKDFYTDASTSGTGETDLYSYTVPANTLINNGDKLIFNITITSVISSATSTYIKCYFGGDFITIVNGENFTYPNGILHIIIEIIKTGTSSLRIIGIPNSIGITSTLDYENVTGVNFSISNIIKVTGQCATNSITARFGYIEYLPAAP